MSLILILLKMNKHPMWTKLVCLTYLLNYGDGADVQVFGCKASGRV